LVVVALLVACIPIRAWGQASDSRPAGENEVKDVVAATVNGVPIFAAQVENEVQRTLGARKVTEDARRLLQAQALQQLVKQQLVLAYLEQREQAASDADIEFAIGRLTDQLARQEKTLDDYLRARGLNPQSLRQTIRWQKSWSGYLAKYLTEDNARRFFEKHRLQFDGTKVRAAHILLKVGASDDREMVKQRALEIREMIVADRLSFADAARRHSESPTAGDGGELGWISRHEPMPQSFSRAAFELKEGAVSEPVVSAFGVHLIRCLEIKPGQKTLQEVLDEVEAAMIRYLFDWTASRADSQARIQYTGAVPHFQPGTKELAQ
jgi:parvulin-like peptidyl-prolyl isomerase